MNESKPYKLREQSSDMVAESVAVRPTPVGDINSLRHDLTDAIYATNNQQLLYSCLVFLNNNQVQSESSDELDSFVANMPKDVLQMASEYAIKESRAGRGIPHVQAMEMIKAKRGWK